MLKIFDLSEFRNARLMSISNRTHDSNCKLYGSVLRQSDSYNDHDTRLAVFAGRDSIHVKHLRCVGPILQPPRAYLTPPGKYPMSCQAFKTVNT